ncbi:MAG: hypothetical protein MHM6MM_004986 [Cercozoa sp. M6MM]
MSASVCVVARFRPQNSREKREGGADAVRVSDCGKVAKLLNHSQIGSDGSPRSHDFAFDAVFGANSSQEAVFSGVAAPLIPRILQGFNATIFAYGQTGSGKTHTMQGEMEGDFQGLIPRLLHALFNAIAESNSSLEFTLKVSNVEIYCEKLRDLLGTGENTKLRIRESKTAGMYIEGVNEVYVSSPQEVLALLERGQLRRACSATGMNAASSRSHSVLSVTVTQVDTASQARKTSKLTLVDLAGSEKVRKTGAEGQLLKEAQNINKSLSALGNVINALVEQKAHVPYRDSKLTRLLTHALGGNSLTTLIVTASTSSWNLEESLSTLRFGQRAQRVQNRAHVNAELSIAEYKRLLKRARNCAAAERELRRMLAEEILRVRHAFPGGVEVWTQEDADRVDRLLEKSVRLDAEKSESDAAEDGKSASVGGINDRVAAPSRASTASVSTVANTAVPGVSASADNFDSGVTGDKAVVDSTSDSGDGVSDESNEQEQELRDELEDARADATIAKERLNHAVTRIDELDSALREERLETERLREQLAKAEFAQQSLEVRCKELQLALSVAEDKNTMRENAVPESNSRNDSNSNINKGSGAASERSSESDDKDHSDTAALPSRVRERSHLKSMTSSEVATLMQQNIHLQKDLERKVQQFVQLQIRFDDMRSEVECLRANNGGNGSADASAVDSAVRQLLRHNRQLTRTFNELSLENERLKRQNRYTGKQVDNLRERVDLYERSILDSTRSLARVQRRHRSEIENLRTEVRHARTLLAQFDPDAFGSHNVDLSATIASAAAVVPTSQQDRLRRRSRAISAADLRARIVKPVERQLLRKPPQ